MLMFHRLVLIHAQEVSSWHAVELFIKNGLHVIFNTCYDASSKQLVICTSQIVKVDIFSMLSIKTYIRLGQVCIQSLTTFCRAQYRAESSVNTPNDLLFSCLCSNYSSANKGHNRRGWFYFIVTYMTLNTRSLWLAKYRVFFEFSDIEL